jgi:hypothetical protein
MKLDEDLDSDLDSMTRDAIKDREKRRKYSGTSGDDGNNGSKPEDKDPEEIELDFDPTIGGIEKLHRELPEDVVKALQDAGGPLTGNNPTVEDLNKALEKQNLNGGEQGLKDLVKETLNNLRDLDPVTQEKIEGALLTAAGVGLAGASIIVAAVAPVPALATGLTTGAGLAAYGLSRYMNAGNNRNTVLEDVKNSFTPPMAELSKIDIEGIR